MAQDPYAAIASPVAARRPAAPAPAPAANVPMVRIGGHVDTPGKTGNVSPGHGVSPANDALLRRYAGMTPDHATQIYQQTRARLAAAHTDPAERARALTAFDTAPAVRAIRQIAGLIPLSTRAQDIRDVAAQALPLQRSNRISEAGRRAAQGREGSAPGFASALSAGVRRSMFGIPERIAAAGARWLPSAITGNDTDASYDEILQATRAGTDEELNRSTGGNILGQIIGSVATGRAAGGAIAQGTSRLAAAATPVLARAGNILQSLTQFRQGARLANTGRIALAGGAGGAAQAVGQGTDPVEGAVTGAIAAPVLGLGFKAAQVVTRPFRDFLRLSSAGRILSRLTTATQDQLEQRAAEYRTATGAEPTVFELLPLADRNRILRQTVVGRDNVVEQASHAIRARADNLGPEMSARARAILQPQRDFIAGGVQRDLTAARGGNAAPEDPALVARAATSPTDMSELRDVEARAIMAPHQDTPIVPNLEDLYPHVPGPRGARVAVDPEVATVIRSAAGTLRARPANAGVTAGDITDMISTLRGDLGRGGIEGRTAERAINHLQDTLDQAAPEAGAAARQMTDAYAARSRMAEGMKEGAAARLRDDVQVGTSRRDARRVRNAYDTPEGAAGRSLGQGNRVISDLGGSPEEALRSTVRMSRNSTGRELSQNVGPTEAEQIMAAARAQDTSAQALSSASQTAQSGGGEASNAETLVQSLVGLHPSSFITTKIGAVRRLMDMTYIPENRARAMVEMLFSQDPALAQRAMNAISNEPNGAQFMRYLSGIAGELSANGGAAVPAENEVPQPEDANPAPPADPNAQEAPADEYSDVATPEEEAPAGPTAEGDSPYAPVLQHIYDTESPELLDLISRVKAQESGGHQHDAHGRPLTSPAGAIGIMQLMPDTARGAARLAGVPWDQNAYEHDANYNEVLGIAELSNQLRRYDGNVRLALIAYNAGPGRADRVAGGDPHIPQETHDYIASIM